MRQYFVRYILFILIFSVLVLSGYTNGKNKFTSGNAQLNSLIERARILVDHATYHDSVKNLLNEADLLAKAIQDQHQSINILLLKGLNEYYAGNYELAIDWYYQALDIAIQSNDSILVARSNHNLGMIYDELEDYDEAINFFQKSLKISQAINDSAQLAKTFQNIAISFQNKKELIKAQEYNHKANQLAMLRKDTAMIIDIANNFGTIAYDQQKLDESLHYYQKALDLYQKTGGKEGIALAYNNIGLVYLDKKEYSKSLDYFNKSLALASELKMVDFIGDVYGNLTIYYKEIQDYKNAYYYYDKFNLVYDSLVGEKKNKMIRQIQAKYQLGKNTRELEELKNKSQSQLDAIANAKLVQVYLVGITILFVLLMVATFYLLYKEKRLAGELKLKTNELHDLNLSKDKFFSIIAHDLKNPFNVLVSYTSILKTDLEMFSNDELKQIISDLNQASENGYNLLQNLLLWTRSQTNRIHVYKTNFILSDIFEQVKGLVELNLIAKRQSLSIEINPDLVVYADKEMIATVMRNLVFNAVKFSAHGSEIQIKTCTNEGAVQVDVVDSGVGIPDNTKEKLFLIDKSITTPGTDGETGTGLGLVICREFVLKNGGSIWVESQLGKGSVFSFTIPIESKQNKSV